MVAVFGEVTVGYSIGFLIIWGISSNYVGTVSEIY